MLIEVGKFYRTRLGYKARIYATDGAASDTDNQGWITPVHGAIAFESGWKSENWGSNGAYYGNKVNPDNKFDLVSEWLESETLWRGWICKSSHNFGNIGWKPGEIRYVSGNNNLSADYYDRAAWLDQPGGLMPVPLGKQEPGARTQV